MKKDEPNPCGIPAFIRQNNIIQWNELIQSIRYSVRLRCTNIWIADNYTLPIKLRIRCKVITRNTAHTSNLNLKIKIKIEPTNTYLWICTSKPVERTMKSYRIILFISSIHSLIYGYCAEHIAHDLKQSNFWHTHYKIIHPKLIHCMCLLPIGCIQMDWEIFETEKNIRVCRPAYASFVWCK